RALCHPSSASLESTQPVHQAGAVGDSRQSLADPHSGIGAQVGVGCQPQRAPQRAVRSPLDPHTGHPTRSVRCACLCRYARHAGLGVCRSLPRLAPHPGLGQQLPPSRNDRLTVFVVPSITVDSSSRCRFATVVGLISRTRSMQVTCECVVAATRLQALLAPWPDLLSYRPQALVVLDLRSG
ncbi:MAG: hypothetical protein ACI9S9_003386, partial [Planctomycetota bacterium]